MPLCTLHHICLCIFTQGSTLLLAIRVLLVVVRPAIAVACSAVQLTW